MFYLSLTESPIKICAVGKRSIASIFVTCIKLDHVTSLIGSSKDFWFDVDNFSRLITLTKKLKQQKQQKSQSAGTIFTCHERGRITHVKHMHIYKAKTKNKKDNKLDYIEDE